MPEPADLWLSGPDTPFPGGRARVVHRPDVKLSTGPTVVGRRSYSLCMNGFDFGTGLAAALRDRAATWDYARGIAAFWSTPLTEGDGCEEAELAASERRLGFLLPAALREGYALLGRRRDLTSNQDVLLPPTQLHVYEDALVFRDENQSVSCWGIPLAALEAEDPPVEIRTDLADKRAERWEPWLGTVSATFAGIVLAEPLLAGVESSDFCYISDDAALATLERDFAELPFPDGPGLRWFAGQDALVQVIDDVGFAARARTPAALDALRERLGGDWLAG